MRRLETVEMPRGQDMARQARRSRCEGRENGRGGAADTRTWRILRKIWRGLREWSGDAAYERYLQSPQTRAQASSVLSPAEFYIEQLNRRYSRPNRCC
jgi:uncharacterized short protein YbdD (DUF466 family)